VIPPTTNKNPNNGGKTNRRPVERKEKVIPPYSPPDDVIVTRGARPQPFYPERDLDLGVGGGEIEEKIIRHHYKNGVLTTEYYTVEKRQVKSRPQWELTRPIPKPAEVHHFYHYSRTGNNELECRAINAPPTVVQCSGGCQAIQQSCSLPQSHSSQRQIGSGGLCPSAQPCCCWRQRVGNSTNQNGTCHRRCCH